VSSLLGHLPVLRIADWKAVWGQITHKCEAADTATWIASKVNDQALR